jgi:MFS family permease
VPHSIDLGFSSITAASILAIVNGASIAGRVLLGIAADKIGNKQVFILSFVLMILLFLGLVSATELWQLYSLAVIFGIAFGGLSVAESPLVAELFGLRSHGLIYGIVNLGWITGASVGPLLTGYIFDLTKSYQMAFPLGAAIAFLGLVLTIVLKPTGEPKAIR